MKFKLESLIFVSILLLAPDLCAQEELLLESIKSSHYIENYMPPGNGYVLENLEFHCEVFLERYSRESYRWKAYFQLYRYNISGYKHDGQFYDVSAFAEFAVDAQKYGKPWRQDADKNIESLSINFQFFNLRNNNLFISDRAIGSPGKPEGVHIFDYQNEGITDLNGYGLKNITITKPATEPYVRAIVERRKREKEKELEGNKDQLKEQNTESEDDFWSGETEATISINTSKNDDDFWSGKENEGNKSDSDFWNGEGKLTERKNVLTTDEEIKTENHRKDEIFNFKYFSIGKRKRNVNSPCDIFANANSYYLMDKNGNIIIDGFFGFKMDRIESKDAKSLFLCNDKEFWDIERRELDKMIKILGNGIKEHRFWESGKVYFYSLTTHYNRTTEVYTKKNWEDEFNRDGYAMFHTWENVVRIKHESSLIEHDQSNSWHGIHFYLTAEEFEQLCN